MFEPMGCIPVIYSTKETRHLKSSKATALLSVRLLVTKYVNLMLCIMAIVLTSYYPLPNITDILARLQKHAPYFHH